MSSLQFIQVQSADKHIQDLIAAGHGVAESLDVYAEVVKLVSVVFQHPAACAAANAHRLGVEELAYIYIMATMFLAEDRLVPTATPIIFTSYWFVDLDRFPEFVDQITKSGQLNVVDHRDDVVANAMAITVGLREWAASRRADAKRAIPGESAEI